MSSNTPIHVPLSQGAMVMIKLDGPGEAFKAVFVGMHVGQCLVVRLPPIPVALSQFAQGTGVAVRYLHHGAIYGFRSEILGRFTQGSLRFLFLAYPFDLERHSLRRDPRVFCCAPARALVGQEEFAGLVMDLGPGGARFKTLFHDDEQAPLVGLGDELGLAFILVGHADDLRAQCKVRSIKHGESVMEMGLQFMEIGEDTARKVAEFVEMVLPYTGDDTHEAGEQE